MDLAIYCGRIYYFLSFCLLYVCLINLEALAAQKVAKRVCKLAKLAKSMFKLSPCSNIIKGSI